MDKYKYLIKNIGFLTLSNFATKILSFFLVPLYTAMLTTEEYGSYDAISSTVSFLIPILTIDIWEGVLRYSLDKKSDKKTVLSVGCEFCIYGDLFVLILLILNHFIKISQLFDQYAIFFFLMFFVNSLSNVVVSACRGFDKIKEVSISSVLNSFIIIILNIYFLVYMRIGIKGYFIANIAGPLTQIIYLAIVIKVHQYLIKKDEFDKEVRTAMIGYSLPAIANAISWSINGLADRYAIIWICGIAANGIYSVASKIPSILNVFQSIFSQAWMLSAVKEFDKEDKNGFFSKMFGIYNLGLVIICSVIIASDKLLASYLYSNDFYLAWKYVPFLTISIIFGALSGYAGSIFATIKKSEYFAKCSGAGAITNIFLNMLFVNLYGPIGAAVATMISYWVVYTVSMIYLKKSMTIKIDLVKHNISYFILVIQSFCLLAQTGSSYMLYISQSFFVVIQLFIYKKEIFIFIDMIKTKIKTRQGI